MATVAAQISTIFSLLSLVHYGSTLRILQISPGWSNSHILFNFRLSKALADHGHNVTVLIPLLSGSQPPHSHASKGVEEILFRLASTSSGSQEKAINAFQDLAFQKPQLSFFFFVTVTFRDLARTTADQVMSNLELMDRLRSRNFDLTMAHPFDLWPVGLSHVLGIENFVWVAPGAFLLDHMYWITAMPYHPATTPNVMSRCSDRMDFGERVKNTALWVLGLFFSSIDGWLPKTENSIYKDPPYHTEADSNLADLARKTRAIFINGESVLDFARPFVPGMFYLGDMEQRTLKALPKDWQDVVDTSDKGLILFSFGTIANTSLMPLELKDAFLKAFAKFPDYTILWRVEGEMPAGFDQQKHIKIVKWMPQRDLLFNPKTKLFITHGGYNSLLETTEAGVPMLLMPLFADQYANAARAAQHGIGLTLDKFTATAKDIEHAIQAILTNDSYRATAKSLSAQLDDHIMDKRAEAMRQIERVASKKRLWPTMRAAQRLNWIQYICLDVIAFLVVVTVVAIRCVLAFVFLIWRLIQSQKKRR